MYEYVRNRPVIYKDGLGLFGFCDLCNLLSGKWSTICEWLCPPPSLNNYEACPLVLSIKIGDELVCWYKCEQSGNVERVQKHDPCNKEKCSNRVFRKLDTGEIDDYSKTDKYWEKPR